jgi:Tol biopolymer transport system component
MRNVARYSRRGVCAGLTLLAATACQALPGARGSSESTGSSVGAGRAVTGTLVLARYNQFFAFDLASRQLTPVGSFGKGDFPSSPLASPDHRQIAYTLFQVPSNPADLGGNDLYVMQADGTGAHLVHSHHNPGGSWEDPSWSAKEDALYATLLAAVVVGGQTKGETATIHRVPLNGGAPVPLIQGFGPAASPDGKWLAYYQPAPQTGLYIADAQGQNVRQLAPNAGFTDLRAPRFSPDSQWLAFAAQGGTARSTADRPSPRNGLADLLGPAIAEADGVPMDLWVIRPDGTGLRQVSSAIDHSPTPAWSPDGQWLAIGGEFSLTLLGISGHPSIQLLSNAARASITWLK